MIPIKLTLQGIYSYQNKQTIDFSKLTASHLFGIFGSVGSGKSTILEAISFALYGLTERLNQKDRTNYNMMNLKSNEFYLEFDFKTGKNHQDEYKFTVRTKRNSKNYDDVGSFDRQCYKKENGEWIPKSDKTAEDILGLSYKNFKQTVIIPQGKFQEFINLTDNDRTKMLKELFNLDKYDLYNQSKKLDSLNKSELENIKGRLEQISEETTSESLKEKEKYLADFEKNIQILVEQHKNATDQENQMSTLKSLFETIAQLSERFSVLEDKQPEMSEREQILKQYEICRAYFKDILIQQNKIEDDSSRNKKQITQKSEQLEKHKKQSEKINLQLPQIKQSYEQKEELQQRANELEHIMTIKNIEQELIDLDKQTIKQEELIKKQEERLKADKEALLGKQNLYSQEKKESPDWDVLNKINIWFTEKNNLLANNKVLQDELKDHKAKIDQLQAEKNELLTSDLLKDLTQKEKQAKTKEIINIIEEMIKINQKKQDDIEVSLSELGIHEKMSEYVSQIKKGSKCPLCGSIDHPDILQVSDVKKQILQLKKNKETLVQTNNKLNKIITELNSLYERFKNLYEQQQKNENELIQVEEKLTKHAKKFIWKNYSADNEQQLKDDIKKATDLKEKFAKYDKEIEVLNKKLETKEIDKLKGEFDKLFNKKTAETTKLDTLKKQIKILHIESYIEKDKSQCEQEKQENTNKYKAVITEYEKLNTQNNNLQIDISSLEGQLTSAKTRQEELDKEQQGISKEINERLESTKLVNIENVRKILAKEIDIAKETNEIQNYNEQLLQTKANLKSEQEKAKGQTYTEEKHDDLLAKITKLAKEIETKNQEKGAIIKTIDNIKTDLEVKKGLGLKMDKLKKREDNLAILKKMFKGSGFVNFVSTKYLQNLCNAANDRFYKLTRQQLKLEIDEKNNFQIRDYLNEGRIRSIKTLSGGQTFQAALSLALALADQVNHLAGAKQNFFFLDEGFGTLDRQSLHTVFDTLKSLHKENRIVGIISHVEELQQEIDVYLSIRNDEELGSLVERSWG